MPGSASTNVNDALPAVCGGASGQGLLLADMNHFVCPEGKFTDISIDGVRLREDGGHFTEAGSVPVARWLVPQIIDAGARQPSLSPALPDRATRHATCTMPMPAVRVWA